MSDEKVVTINTYELLVQHWPFILSALGELNETVKEEPVDVAAFFRYHADVATGANYGRIFLLTSKNDKPLAFISASAATSKYRSHHTLWVYCIYSNNKKQGATKIIFGELEKWAKAAGFTEIRSESGRTSGASIRWCKDTFGLLLSKMVFRKLL